MIFRTTLLFFTAIILCCAENNNKLRRKKQSATHRINYDLLKNVLHEDETFLFRNLQSSIVYESKPTKSPTRIKTSPPVPVPSPIPIPSPIASISMIPPSTAPIRVPEAVTASPFRVTEPLVFGTEPPTWKVTPPPIYREGSVSGAKAASTEDFSCDDPESRKDGILYVLSGISDKSALQDSTSPEGKASQWIIENDTMSLCPDSTNLLQRYILTLLYFSTNGNEWDRCFEDDSDCLVPYNWTPYLSDKPECKWVGTFCNVDGNITGIIFKKNGMSGTLPTELTVLSFLEALVIEGGDIYGNIPQNIGDLQKLKFIDLSDNNLTGTLPKSLYDINTLVQLDLSQNQLTGPISSDIGSMESLEFLQLDGNQLSGNVPKELANLNSLQEVTLIDNQFSGNVPTDICQSRDNAGGNIQVLTADCSSDELSCDCCTAC